MSTPSCPGQPVTIIKAFAAPDLYTLLHVSPCSRGIDDAACLQEMVSDMDDVEQRSWGRLADWMKQRYHAECSAVSAVHKLASEAAFAGQPLPFQLDLQVMHFSSVGTLFALVHVSYAQSRSTSLRWVTRYMICVCTT